MYHQEIGGSKGLDVSKFLFILVTSFSTMCFAVTTQCNSYEDCLNQGRENLNSNDTIEIAINYLDKAIRYNDHFPQAYNYRGIAYTRLGKIGNAMRDFNAAIDLKSDFAEAYNNRANLWKTQGKEIKALNNYTKAIKHNNQLVSAWYNRALIYTDLDEYEKEALQNS